MKQMKFKTIIGRAALVASLGLAPALIACGGGGGKDDAQAKAGAADKGDAAKDASKKAVDPAVQKEADDALSADKGLDPRVQKAVNVAREIDADPTKADEVLAKYKLQRTDLDALMFEIARDPKLAESYAAARQKS